MLRSDIDNDAFEQVVVLEGNQGQYRLHDMRLKQSQKAVAVFTLGLRVWLYFCCCWRCVLDCGGDCATS